MALSLQTLSRRVPAHAAPTRRRAVHICAATQTTRDGRSTYEPTCRVLRYPNGDERRIIYPTAPAPEIEVEEVDWSLWTQEDESISWNECGLAGSACHVADPDPLVEELASLARRAAPSHDVAGMVKGSYQVLSGSPWLLPRPLFVLAQQQQLTGQGTLYCLQTRVQQEGVQDELAALLKRPDLASELSFSRLKDGVVAFDREEDAARYATCLEADLADEVEVMEVDSRQLFLLTGDSQAVVVYLPWSEFMPLPHQLAASLRAE